MANTYYDSTLGGNEIEAVLETINGLIVPANNGKILYVDNGQIKAKSPSSGGGSAVLESLSVTENGDYYPGSGVDGFDEVHVNVSGGGGSVFAFVKAVYTQGHTITATDGTTTLTGDTSGEYVFAIPNSGTWTFSDGTRSKTITINTYGTSEVVIVGQGAVRIWTKSGGSYDAAMYIQNGIYFNGVFIAYDEKESVPYNTVQGTTTKDCYGLATLSYPSNWVVKASKAVSDGTNTFAAGDTVKTWGFTTPVDFVLYEV